MLSSLWKLFGEKTIQVNKMIQEYFTSKLLNKCSQAVVIFLQNLMKNDSTANKTLHVTFVGISALGLKSKEKSLVSNHQTCDSMKNLSLNYFPSLFFN